MNILHVIPFFTPRRGGSVTAAYNLCRELSKSGHRITIITTDYEFDKIYAESLKGIEVIPFTCSFRLGLFLFSPSMKKWLKKNIDSFDIVHLHNFRSYQNNIAHIYALKHNIPIVLQAHGSVPRIMEKEGLKWIYDIIWGNKIIRDSTKLIAVSSLEASQYRQFGGDDDKIISIPNGIDLQSFKKKCIEKGSFRRQISVDANRRVLLFVGRIHKVKGLGFLLEGFKELLTKRKDVILIIAGPDDGYKAGLQELIGDYGLKENVIIVGNLDNVSQAYVDADLLIYPSQYEIFGLVPFEALLCGTPVVVTENSGCCELMRDTGCALSVKYGDIKGLEEKMEYALNNKDLMEHMIEKGQLYIVDNLDLEVIGDRFCELYENCLHNL
jgi:glycosyltransferase involved in cell wall biosynthesis